MYLKRDVPVSRFGKICLLENSKKGNALFNDALNTFYLRLYND